MKIARLITAILVSIFLFNTTYVLSDNNNDFSKNRVEQARSIFKQIEKGNWSLALKKSKKINNKMLSDLIYWLYLNKKKNKCILFSSNTELFRKYLESILFFANPKKIFYFVINRKESKTN